MWQDRKLEYQKPLPRLSRNGNYVLCIVFYLFIDDTQCGKLILRDCLMFLCATQIVRIEEYHFQCIFNQTLRVAVRPSLLTMTKMYKYPVNISNSH